jgi:parvulin-like peptidyl-prolyl isomerase
VIKPRLSLTHAVLTLAILCGGTFDPQQTSEPQPKSAPQKSGDDGRKPISGAGPAARSPGRDGDAIAIVNGAPIPKQRLVDMLLESHGIAILQQLIALELARQDARRLDITISPQEVDEEFHESVRRIAPDVDASGVGLDDAEKRRSLNQLLDQKGISFSEFLIGMERNAYLRRIIDREFEVNEKILRDEFARSYGERVEIRHIQLNDQKFVSDAQVALAREEDFAEVARKISQNPDSAPKGGLLDPFTFTDEEIPAALREAAFALEPGEVSPPIRVEKRIHILKLERRIPPDNVSFDDVKSELERKARERVIPQQMRTRMLALFDQAKIQIMDQVLKSRYDELLRRNEQSKVIEP